MRTLIVSIVEHDEVFAFIEGHKLMGKGLGYIDVHLLASAVLSGLSIWTLDKRLGHAADIFGHKHHKKAR
jgi:hypothetical protein